ncbi:bifunctional diguanylate cyclase/phosphodiesterase [Methylobacterium sp. ID0610]|uniref:bifunctional diguanylate cyclase/phosphodiesterase n=1 Tax=Methylobacterium carpenticola TaxID=3344827 RepID=UPI00368FD503
MFEVAECVLYQHQRALVLLAAGVWTVGSFAFFLILRRARECTDERRALWVAIGALAGGTGVWATHFVAMLAYDGPMPLSFDLGPTILSLAAIIATFWFVGRATVRDIRPIEHLAVGSGAALGIGLMHLIGMTAIRAAAQVQYEVTPIALGVLVAALCLVAASAIFARCSGYLQIAAPALLAIVAVCALHFTAMAATTLVPDPHMATPPAPTQTSWVVGAIVAATLILLVVTSTAVVIDRTMTDLRGLVGATLEGLVVVQADRVIEANERFCAMLGLAAGDLIGRSADRWLRAADGLPASTPRAQPAEAVLLTADGGTRITEIVSRTIAYRGRTCEVLAVRDLTEKQEARRQIEHLAHHDPLTDLSNRVLFDARLAAALARAAQTGGSAALIALDLDRFKAVNDIFGHAKGDDILCRVAVLLREAAGPDDTVARVGGDEFMILQSGEAQPESALALVERILAAFAREMDLARDPTAIGVSIGVAVYPKDGTEAEALRHAADLALYRAKASGRGQASFFDREMDLAMRERRAMEHDLRHAILRRQMSVVFQPLVTASGRSIAGYEALLRWTHPLRGPIPPGQFIPIAEETGSIVQLGEWVLRESCRSAVAWPPHIFLAVNVSPVQFQVPNLAETVAAILAETGFPAARLELEVTESVLLRDRVTTLATLHRLKDLGVRVVMDDFGTGYSSLSNLQSFPFDKIKIDRSFVAAMAEDAAARSIIRAIVGLGHSLAMPVVAEGIETEAQLRMIIEEGCPQAQGYLFGRPGPSPVCAAPVGRVA